MKKLKPTLIASILVFAPVFALAQGTRYDNFASTINTTTGFNNLMQVIPGAKITVCNFPGTGGTPCTNLATTYTDQTLSVACNTSTQVVLQGTSSCVANGDAFGNFGFWVPSNLYTYCISGTGVITQCYAIVAGSSGTVAATVAIAPRFVQIIGDGSNNPFTIGHNDQPATVGTRTLVAATATESPSLQYASTATASLNTVASIIQGSDAGGMGKYTFGTVFRYSERFRPNQTTNCRFWLGWIQHTSGTTEFATDTPNFKYAAFRYSAGTDSTWKAAVGTATASQTVVDTGVTPSTASSALFEIVNNTTSFTFLINGTVVATISTTLPATSDNVMPVAFYADNKNTANVVSANLWHVTMMLK